jgi:hypothetical protein
MAHALSRWIPEATDTHSEYVILTAFPRQQRLGEGAWMLGYTYIVCLVFAIKLTWEFKMLIVGHIKTTFADSNVENPSFSNLFLVAVIL